jgi:ribose 1,5-bisphosphokinase PhnN
VTGPIANLSGHVLQAIPLGGENREPVFVGDGPAGPDLLDMRQAIQPIAELCAHRDTQTPLMIGIVGPSGSGKSFALEALRVAVADLAAAAEGAADSAFVARIVTVPIDAATICGDPASAIAAAAFVALGRDNYAALADEAAHAGADPYQAANKALERHDEARRRLDAERQSRDEVEARRARVVENVLFETAGSRVDAYARAARGQIETRLRRFDLAAGDSTANFKVLVRDLADAGWRSRLGVILSAIWGYRSQRRLLLASIVFFALAFGASELRTQRAIDWLRSLGSMATPVADWLAAHTDLVGVAMEVFLVLGAIALVANFWRALFFAAMLFRGARLLNYDVRERRRDLDAASARLNRRVAALTAETEAASKHAEAAEKRANARGEAITERAPPPLFMEPALAGASAARAFLVALGKLIGAQGVRAPIVASPAMLSARAIPGSQISAPSAQPPTMIAPERVFLAFDNLDALAPAQALNLIETAHSLLGPSFVGALACDPAVLAPALGGPEPLRARFDKFFQLTFNARVAGAANSARLIARLMGGGGTPQAPEPAIEASRSELSEPLSVSESTLLAALAPLAATTPRAVKRYLNAYRIARGAVAKRPALALMLALGQSGDDQTIAGMDLLLTAQDGTLDDPPGPPALVAAIRATSAANGAALTIAETIAAREIAQRYQCLD